MPEFRRKHLGPVHQHDGVDNVRDICAKLIHGCLGIHENHFSVSEIRIKFTHNLKGHRAATVSALYGESVPRARRTQVIYTVHTTASVCNDEYALLANR